MQVAQWLQAASVDLLEISGGTYEQLSFFGTGAEGDRAPAKARSTLAREAYFLEYAERMRKLCRIPLMVTGGFRSLIGMNQALSEDALDVIGLGRPLCVDTDLPRRLLSGEAIEAPRYERPAAHRARHPGARQQREPYPQFQPHVRPGLVLRAVAAAWARPGAGYPDQFPGRHRSVSCQ
jgi:2,4-dienoyl-CoA reductase-like NADH-dependent reductase (Old Yellow Enzyme family)